MIIGFPQKPKGLGGPSSFQLRFENELKRRNWQVVYPEDKIVPDLIMVVGSTSKLKWLLLSKKNGTKIIHRLDGMTWRIFVRYYGVKTSIRGVVINILVNTIRSRIADHIVYQSRFARNWWLEKKGKTKANANIIYNGTNLEIFKPHQREPDGKIKVICAEGTLEPDPFIIDLLIKIATAKPNGKEIEISVLGKTSQQFEEALKQYQNIIIVGHIPKNKVADYHKTHDIFLSIEINPACPNAIVEALASGLPVIGFDSGAVAELVTSKEGIILPYVNDPWKLEWPVMDKIVEAFEKIDQNYEWYHNNAVDRAKNELNSVFMTEKYLDVINTLLINN